MVNCSKKMVTIGVTMVCLLYLEYLSWLINLPCVYYQDQGII